MYDVELIQGDLTTMEVGAIVNAANTALLAGGEYGVNGAIHTAGGPDIAEACKKIRIKLGGCKTGEAVITTAGLLKAKYVIHAVGPVWKGGESGEKELLKNCYINSLALADEYQLKSVAFPNISTGIYGFPKELAAGIAIDGMYSQLVKCRYVKKVIFVCHNPENYELYKKLLEIE
ncbi:O-acetyl-ADP-ribose deacetylase [Rapidithrix thailandica]|uniref:O-acetyl-ADP-ribose deacetylase n=1 Tax=Rapidithrix thailandica TaxID=413964 RepID=A0AAW9S681_9BACT